MTVTVPRWLLLAVAAVALVAAAVIVTLLLTNGTDEKPASSTDEKFPPGVRQELLAQCITAGGTARQCECGVARLDEDLTTADLLAFGTRNPNGNLNRGSPRVRARILDAVAQSR